MIKDNLRSIAKAIVAKQKGVLAADESNPTIKKRFDTINRCFHQIQRISLL